MGKCETCTYLKTIIATLLEDNRALLDRLMLREGLPTLTPPVIEEKEKTPHELAVEKGEAYDYGDTE